MRTYLLPLLMTLSLGASALSPSPSTMRDETIVLIRHGEKPQPARGQLSCKGLNRALALPTVLARFGRPDAIYAPSPAARIKDGDNSADAPSYSYLRPLTTIEPYAIQLGMPVNAQIAYDDLPRLDAEVTQTAFAHAYVLIAWEHLQAVLFAQHMLAQFGENPNAVPRWPNSDYDTVYVFHLTEDKAGKRHLDFRIDHEGLSGRLSDACPTVNLGAPNTIGTSPSKEPVR